MKWKAGDGGDLRHRRNVTVNVSLDTKKALHMSLTDLHIYF